MKNLTFKLALAGLFLLQTTVISTFAQSKTSATAKKPNIIVILADDMGFSDIGSYGGEIPTPNIDMLANGGVRLTDFYNNSRCCPTRASLLTGLYPHQAGIGDMAEDPGDSNVWDEGVPGYRGFLTPNTVTIAEVMKTAGYNTYMTGKWHVGMHGQEKWPLQRGFDKFYGILSGASSYLRPFPPRGITEDNSDTKYDFPNNYYTTNAFADQAIKFINEEKNENPYLLYLAFTAPHWPLQALPEDIKLMEGMYKKGWDSVRYERMKRQVAMGLTKQDWGLGEREMRPWNKLNEEQQKDVAYRMTVYAAMVYRMDKKIGDLINNLKARNELDNTLIIFMSDNGACAEPYQELGGGRMVEINDGLKYGPISYGMGWANVSNTPYKKYKNQTYEGGIAAPLIAYWPNRIKKEVGKLNSTPFHIIDLMQTICDAGGATYPTNYKGNKITPTEGISMLPTFIEGKGKTHEYFYWEHEGHCAVRYKDWKIVKTFLAGNWELFDMKNDRTERTDVAAQHPDIVKTLDEKWTLWANSHQVFPKGKDFKDNVANHFNKYKE